MELTLSMTMYSILILGIGTTGQFMGRAVNLAGTEIRLQNELEYIIQDMELHLKHGKDIDIVETNKCGGTCVVVVDQDNRVIRYEFLSDRISRSIKVGTFPAQVTQLSENNITASGEYIPIFSVESVPGGGNSKLVRVRFGAIGNLSDKFEKSIRIDGIDRMIYLRGGEDMTVTSVLGGGA